MIRLLNVWRIGMARNPNGILNNDIIVINVSGPTNVFAPYPYRWKYENKYYDKIGKLVNIFKTILSINSWRSSSY